MSEPEKELNKEGIGMSVAKAVSSIGNRFGDRYVNPDFITRDHVADAIRIFSREVDSQLAFPFPVTVNALEFDGGEAVLEIHFKGEVAPVYVKMHEKGRMEVRQHHYLAEENNDD